MNRRKHYGALILAGIFFGTTGTAQALGPSAVSGMVVGSARLICGALLLWLVSHFSLSAPRRIPGRHLWLAAVGIALYQITFFSAVKSTGVTIGTVTALGFAPALTGIVAFLLTRERPSHRWLLATFITSVGIVILANSKGFSHFNAIGFTLAICASASYSLFAVSSKTILNTGIEISQAMSRIFALAALLTTPFLFIGNSSGLVSTKGLLMILWLGLVPTAFAYIAYAYGLRGIRASTATTLILVEPATATLLAAFVLGESLNRKSWVGIAIIFTGLLYLSRE
jgi:DME family drug/metabolite transporter